MNKTEDIRAEIGDSSKTTIAREVQMTRRSRRLFAVVCLTAAPLLVQVGCKQSEGGGFECLNAGDCPPGCSCDNEPLLGDLVAVCESDETGRDCGGSCDAETQCPAGTSCVRVRTDGEVDFYSCQGGGTGGTGGMGGMGGTGGSPTLADRCEASNAVYCNNGYDCNDAGWAVSAEAFADLYGQSREDCLSSGDPCTTEEAFCEGNGGGTYNAANHEACISGQMTTNCAVDELNLPVFPAVCDELCVAP